MGVWYPDPAKPEHYRCRRHPAVKSWPSGKPCSECELDPPPPDEIDENPAPVAPDLPKTVDHERSHVQRAGRIERAAAKLIRFGNRCLRAAKKYIDEEDADAAEIALQQAIACFNTAAKLEAEGTKKRRAAAEITRWREDWSNTEALEKELRALREAHH